MMGHHQQTAAGSSTLLTRTIVALTVAAIMALTASPAFAGNGEAKGQKDTNPDRIVKVIVKKPPPICEKEDAKAKVKCA